ncbi:MAG: hypothetical protein NUV67_03995 [archaeon]|nr:hypothetical protein [archaeon]
MGQVHRTAKRVGERRKPSTEVGKDGIIHVITGQRRGPMDIFRIIKTRDLRSAPDKRDPRPNLGALKEDQRVAERRGKSEITINGVTYKLVRNGKLTQYIDSKGTIVREVYLAADERKKSGERRRN